MGLSLRQKAGFPPPIFYSAVTVHPMMGILYDSLGKLFCPVFHIQTVVVGNLTLKAPNWPLITIRLHFQVLSLLQWVLQMQDPGNPQRRSRPGTSFPKTPGPAGTGQHWAVRPLCLQDPQPQAWCPTPSTYKNIPPPPTPVPAGLCLWRNKNQGDESPPLQGSLQ